MGRSGRPPPVRGFRTPPPHLTGFPRTEWQSAGSARAYREAEVGGLPVAMLRS
jgi:hypothetical protein